MITLNVADLRKFKPLAAKLATHPTLPILSNLKFSGGMVTKNNISSFVSQPLDAGGAEFLISESFLMNFIASIASPTIQVKIEDTKITLFDGKNKSSAAKEDVANFPSTEKEQGDSEFEMDADMLEAIGVSANIVLLPDSTAMPVTQYVFVGKNLIAGADNIVCCLKKFDKKKFPECVLRKDVASAIGRYETLTFSQNESFHFFQNEDIRFGFQKSEYPFVDMSAFGKFEEGINFTIDKNDLINFNNLAIGQANHNSKVFVCRSTIEIKDNRLLYESFDTTVSTEFNGELPVNSNGDIGKFTFNTAALTKLLKSLPGSELTFHQGNKKYYITGEYGYTSLIMGVAD